MDPAALNAWRALLASWDTWLLTIALVAGVPALGYFRFRQSLARGNTLVSTRAKLTLYGKIVCSQWFLVAVMLFILRHHGLSARDAGQSLANAQLTLGVTCVLVFILAIVSTIVLMRVRRARSKNLIRGMGRMQKLVPAFGLEMAAFVAVCLTAGICEELLYRGWLMNILMAATGSAWIAVGIGAIVFGVGHAYQGIKGVLRAIFVAIQLGVLYVLVGSLIPGQVLHAGVDLLIGVAGALAVSRTDSSASSSGEAATSV
jgi:uncharacterized protein